MYRVFYTNQAFSLVVYTEEKLNEELLKGGIYLVVPIANEEVSNEKELFASLVEGLIAF